MRKVCLALMLALASAGLPAASAAADDPSFPTAAAALEALRTKPGVKTSVQSGWTVIEDEATLTLWSFPPQGHPAYPAAVRRQVVQEGAGVFLRMSVLCEAPKPACDAMVADFEKLTGRIQQQLQR